MYYESVQQEPSVYVPFLLIGIVITLVVYGAFPIILAMGRKEIITKTKYNLLCFGANFFVMFLLFALIQESSGSPYILWTCVFSSIGLKILKKRGVLEGFQNVNKGFIDNAKEDTSIDENKINFCRKCANRLLDKAKFCNKCGAEVIDLEE